MTNAYSIDDLVLREGLYYEKFTDKPFTGKLDEAQGRGALKDGKAEVPWVMYWSNGQLRSKGAHKNGKREGPWVTYHDNGQLASAGAYKSGKPDLSEQSL
jgi:hypothetical protein